jgi:two-component system sensor histidine kinase KdpD
VGLGLAVARGLTEAMSGSVTASDTPGGGLTMTVELPAVNAPATAVPQEQP